MKLKVMKLCLNRFKGGKEIISISKPHMKQKNDLIIFSNNRKHELCKVLDHI